MNNVRLDEIDILLILYCVVSRLDLLEQFPLLDVESLGTDREIVLDRLRAITVNLDDMIVNSARKGINTG
jgi:hypothetical protein